MLSIDSAKGDDIVCGVTLLQDKYLVAEGFMLNPENDQLVKSLLRIVSKRWLVNTLTRNKAQ